MLSYIYGHYRENITLEDIAKAADINRSEAGRCFKRYMSCSPMDALIQYRLQVILVADFVRNMDMHQVDTG